MKATKCDVVVVGAGAMGSAAAWWLARRGADVVVLERFGRGHDRGSSHGATRIFRLVYEDPSYVRMAREALALWRELEDDGGVTLLDTTGGIDHGPSGRIDALARTLQREAVRHQVLSPEAAHERWPGMRFDETVLFQPDAGRCWADRTVAALQDGAARHGADVHFDVGQPELRWSADGSALKVGAGDHEWRPRVVVVTVGAWVTEVLGDHLRPEPHTVTLEQVQHFAPTGSAGECTAWPSFLHHRRDEPSVYGLLSPGEGVKVDEHHAGREVDPEHDSREADPVRRKSVSRYVGEWFPGLDPAPRHTTTCLYTTTADESFRISRHGPVVVGMACSGHGFKFTPLIGRRLADLVAGGD